MPRDLEQQLLRLPPAADRYGRQRAAARLRKRSTGELTLGFIAEADFTYISPLDQQYGINSEGKISQFLPETKHAGRPHRSATTCSTSVLRSS